MHEFRRFDLRRLRHSLELGGQDGNGTLHKAWGSQTGPSCCDHVTAFVYAGDPAIEFGTVEFDVMGDGTEMFEYYICAPCLRKFNLEKKQIVSEEIWASKERFSYVGPVCGKCFQALMGLRNNDPS